MERSHPSILNQFRPISTRAAHKCRYRSTIINNNNGKPYQSIGVSGLKTTCCTRDSSTAATSPVPFPAKAGLLTISQHTTFLSQNSSSWSTPLSDTCRFLYALHLRVIMFLFYIFSNICFLCSAVFYTVKVFWKRNKLHNDYSEPNSRNLHVCSNNVHSSYLILIVSVSVSQYFQ